MILGPKQVPEIGVKGGVSKNWLIFEKFVVETPIKVNVIGKNLTKNFRKIQEPLVKRPKSCFRGQFFDLLSTKCPAI